MRRYIPTPWGRGACHGGSRYDAGMKGTRKEWESPPERTKENRIKKKEKKKPLQNRENAAAATKGDSSKAAGTRQRRATAAAEER